MKNKWINLKSFNRQNRLVDIAPKHCFEVTFAHFEQIINNDFKQLETEWLNEIN